jgi:hypothetical protein
MRELNVEVELAQDAARLIRGLDMREVLASGECCVLVLPSGVPNRTFSPAEAKREIGKLVDDGQDANRIICINVIATWSILLQRVAAMVSAQQPQQAGR